ncbi:MAG: hypothetical protein J6A09_00155 [Alphaproteobacteria bacterium]|nr:hypothetical protein [Alphaproteobacteria bacterium]
MNDTTATINIDALSATASPKNDTMTESGGVNMDALYGLASKYFEEHPDIPLIDKSKNGMINAYLQAQALAKNNQANQQQTAQNFSQQQAPQAQANGGAQSGDLFGMLFDSLVRATIHEAMHHHCHWACPHGHFSRLSFGLPPYMMGCHDRFCHRVDARAAHNRVKTAVGALEMADGISNITRGNTASGILGTIGGAANIASVILDKKRGRC